MDRESASSVTVVLVNENLMFSSLYGVEFRDFVLSVGLLYL